MSRHGAVVVLDFSGTLSVAGSRFAGAQHLADRLRDSGLWELGIDSPRLFWERLVNPTWQRGSTTSDGYAAVLAGAAAGVLHERGRDVPPATIERAAAAFAGHYFAHSAIAPQWRDWLRRLHDLDGVALVIATDHYAEATAHITAELATLGIDGAPVAHSRPVHDRVLIANSADLGHHKTSAEFWVPVRDALGADHGTRLVLIDDFGATAADNAGYAERARIRRRSRATRAALQEVFGTPPHVVAFVIPPGASEDDLAGMVRTAERSTMTVLSDPS